MPFGPVAPDLDLPALEQRMLDRWRDDDIVAAARSLRAGNEPWIFYEGPPTANGRPGLHHVWARVFKDIYPRFQTMRGRQVPRKGGWDCHGLPVELEVEKELGLSTKHEIEAFGIAEFNRRCRESVHRYVADWEALTDRAGVWIDTADAYWTLDNTYVESVWWLIRQLWDKGLLYEGHKVSPYCGRCGTALSSHELGQPDVYRDVVDPSVYVRFPVEGRDVDLLVWTTTPWTLISNVAAAVGPDIAYVRVAATDGSRDLVMAEARAPEDAEVVERFTGADLVGWRYERPFTFLAPPPGADGWRVVAADFVTTDDGSGIVHLAPAFGEDDAAVGPGREAARAQPGERRRRLRRDACRPTPGRFVKDADRDIIADLSARGPARARAGLRAQLPPLLALLARRSSTGPRPRGSCAPPSTATSSCARTSASAGTPSSSSTAASASGSRATSTGPSPATATGARRCRSGAATRPATSTASARSPSCPALTGDDLTELDLHRPYVDDITFGCTTDGCTGTDGPRRPRARRLVRLRLDAVGPAPLPVRRRRRRRGHPGRLPRRLHLRGHRPDPRLVLLAAGGELAGVRLHART